ncbi:MAG: curli production assembly protein CsgG [Alphaproteobacteria bacterium]|nr:curli production assembly protein CsgG [Alphaproteobacteria bacterium]
MHRSQQAIALCIAALGFAGCATIEKAPERIAPTTIGPTAVAATPAVPTLKRKIAVARFSNSTNYGKALLTGGELDPLAAQAADMLTARLVDTGRFMVFERGDLDAVKAEGDILKIDPSANLVGVDALIIGSVTEFGRKTEGQSGFLSSTKKQTAVATVEARLVDPRTGLAFFSASGKGNSAVEAGEVAGFGSRAAYDSSINDSAISAAISDLASELVGKLQSRRWTTDVLRIDGDRVFVSGGKSQGLKVGDKFSVETRGETVKSGQSGLPITLPGEHVAEIQIASFFGDGEYGEGSTATLVSGSLAGREPTKLIVVEDK